MSVCACRLVFAAGVCCTFALAAGQHSADSAASFMDDTGGLWACAGSAVEAALLDHGCIAESTQAMDEWATDTGPFCTSEHAAVLASVMVSRVVLVSARRRRLPYTLSFERRIAE
jgi:hypothetical protein